MSSSEYSSESASDSDSGSSTSDSNSELLARPVFLKKSSTKTERKPLATSNVALARAEHHQNIDAKEVAKQDFDGVDDTDNIDPEKEYNLWKLREKDRKLRDHKKLEDLENEKEDALRRQMNRDEGASYEVEKVQAETSKTKKAYLGSFYSSSIEENILKRDYRDIEDLGDHSRPTKYKR